MPRKKTLPLKPEAEDYARFLRNIKLVGLALANCSANLERGAYFDLATKGKSTRNISADYRLLEIQREFFDVAAKFTLAVQDKGAASEPLTIACGFVGHFHCSNGLVARDFAERFTQSELRLILWPYFRELVSDLTAKMAIPPILVPLSTEK